MAYAKLEPSGCGIHKDRVKLRISMYLEPTDPYYEKHHVYVPVLPEGGYPGKLVGVPPEPESQADFDAWFLSLPHIWQNNPFHNHFIYPNLEASDNAIKEQIERSFNYFYSFHQYAWDNDLKFIDEWKKVPRRVGDARCPIGKPQDVELCTLKTQDIVSRLSEFEIGKKTVPDVNLNIGDKGTIDIGMPAIGRPDRGYAINFMYLNHGNPANASGTIDTYEIYAETNMGGCYICNHFLVSGITYECRDSESVGTVTAGSKQTYSGLTIDVVTGDKIASHSTSGYIESTNTGEPGYGAHFGEARDPTDQADFTLNSGRAVSLYGTGTEPGPEGVPAQAFMHMQRMRRQG